jgi:tRNA1Val (adenine37-N6)-methyltransferase
MKVCTDACLFGAWAAEKVKSEKSKVKTFLDVGAGTGLLSLMLAQKNNDAIISAVEIDEQAAKQAQQNFEASPWKDRLNVYHTSIQLFNQSTLQLYDLIISNPPFFEKDLKSNDNKRNLALHSAELSFEELLQVITKHLKEDGVFAVLLPFYRTTYFEKLATVNNYTLHEKVLIKQTPKHDYFRSMLLFSKQAVTYAEKEVLIMNEQGSYTDEFIALLKDYYLYL